MMRGIGQYYSKNKRFCKAVIVMTALTVCFILLSFIKAWADFYADHIYFFFCKHLSRLVELIPFPLGELLMYIGAALIIIAVLLLILRIFLGKKKKYIAFLSVYLRTLTIVILSVLLIYSTQWLTTFRSSVLGKPGYATREYTTDELGILYLYLVDGINEECGKVPRNEAGDIIYDDKETVEQKVSVAMNAAGDEFPRLKGYYPTIKAAWCSDELHWMGIGGYTYPYTLELTYNKYVNNFRFSSLYAHESCHHMGYFKEHEANFLAYIACKESDDPILRYTAYYYVLRYVDDAYHLACLNDGNEEIYLKAVKEHPVLSQVKTDYDNAVSAAEERFDRDEHPLEDYADEVEKIGDTGWNTQADILGEYNYDGVVDLLLQYYDGKLY